MLFTVKKYKKNNPFMNLSIILSFNLEIELFINIKTNLDGTKA